MKETHEVSFLCAPQNGDCPGISLWMWPFYSINSHNKMGSLNLKNCVQEHKVV